MALETMASMPVRCSVVRAQRRPDSAAGEVKELVYNVELLQNLLTIAGIKVRRAKLLAESILQHLSAEAHKDPVHRHVELSTTPRQDGTLTVELQWEDLMYVVATIVQARSFHPTLKLADSLLQRERGVIIMICGTSGTGKSTLASLLGQRLGISTIMSTDSIRNQLRGFISEEQDPILHASSYETDNALLRMRPELEDEPQRRLIKKGYKAQCSTVLSQVQTLVNMWQSSCASVIVEGVHLHLKQVMQMMSEHPSILPFLVYVKREAKHIERMSVRAKYMTTDPSRNKYVKNMKGIRQIQDYLLRTADKVAVPKVANCNVELALEIIHKTVMAALYRQTDPSKAMVDENGKATALLEEFNIVYSQQCATQTQIKETHAKIQSLVENSSVMQNISASSDTVFDFDSPGENPSMEPTFTSSNTPVLIGDLPARSARTCASLQASDQSGGKIGPFLPDDIASGREASGTGAAVPSKTISAAGSILEPFPGADDGEQDFGDDHLDSWGLWEARLADSGANSPHSSACDSPGAIVRFLWGDVGDGERRHSHSPRSQGRSSPGLSGRLHQEDTAEGLQLSDGHGELAVHASRVPLPADDAVPSVSGTEQQLGLKDIVRARPTPEKDSSSESDTSAAENHEDDVEELRSRTLRSAARLVLASNLSATENGSLCDSTEVQIDDDEALARLWSTLLPDRGRWHEAVEPARSAMLLRALVAHLQHPAASTALRWMPSSSSSSRMRTASSAPAPLRASFNYQTRLRVRSFGSGNHSSRALHAPADAMFIPYEVREVRELSITDGVPSLSQISSTASHHSNETASPRAVPSHSPTTWAAPCSVRVCDQCTHTNCSGVHTDPVINPISPSSFCPMGPHAVQGFLPPVGASGGSHARSEKQPILPSHSGAVAVLRTAAATGCEKGVDAPISPAASPPQPYPSFSFSVFQSGTTSAAVVKSKTAATASGATAPTQLRTVLQQLSEDVETLLQGQERSQEEALRQMQSISSQLSVRMSRPETMHGPHHALSRSSVTPVHLAAVAEDASPEERPFTDDAVNQSRSRGCPACREGPTLHAAATAAVSRSSGVHSISTGVVAASNNGRERPRGFSRIRRKLSGLMRSERKGRFLESRSEGEKMWQQATTSAHEHVEAVVSPCCAHGGQAESSMRCDASDVSLEQPHRDTEAHTHTVCNDRDQDERVGRCRESNSLRLGVEGCLSSEWIEKIPVAQDKDPTDAGSSSEASADVEDESIPLVHALVVRVMHQFAMTKAHH